MIYRPYTCRCALMLQKERGLAIPLACLINPVKWQSFDFDTEQN